MSLLLLCLRREEELVMTDGVTLGCNATRGFAVKTTLIHRCEILAAAMDQPSCETMKTLISAFELNENTLTCPMKKQQFVLLFFFKAEY